MGVAGSIRGDGRRMKRVGKRAVRVRVVRTFAGIGMIRPARVDNLLGPQNGAAIFAFSVAAGSPWGTRRKLFAYILWQRQATACASVTVCASQDVQFRSLICVGLPLDKTRVFFDVMRRVGLFGWLRRFRRGGLLAARPAAKAVGGNGIM